MKKLSLLVLLLMCCCLSVLKAQQALGAPESVAKKPAPSTLARSSYLGLGSGLSYGWNGFNVEVPVYRKLYLQGGAGLIYLRMGNLNQHLTAPAYNLGMGVSISSPDKKWQRRLIALYGINGFAWQLSPQGPGKKSYNGISLGLSNSYMFDRQGINGFTFDVYYIASSTYYLERWEKKSPFRLGLGYRRKL